MGDTVKFCFRLRCDTTLTSQLLSNYSPRFRRFPRPWPSAIGPSSYFVSSSVCGVANPSPSGELVMLASINNMETVRSFPRDSGASLRQPSAEDLDAAQQLISSAQAGREHAVDTHGRGPVIKYSGSPTPEYAPVSTPGAEEKAASSDGTSPQQKDTSFLGHSCR